MTGTGRPFEIKGLACNISQSHNESPETRLPALPKSSFTLCAAKVVCGLLRIRSSKLSLSNSPSAVLKLSWSSANA